MNLDIDKQKIATLHTHADENPTQIQFLEKLYLYSPSL